MRLRRDDTGAAAVEFALVLPLLLLLVFGIISYGYMLSFRQALSQGAAEGARAAAVALVNEDKESLALQAANEAIGTYQNIKCNEGAMVCSVTVDPCNANGDPAYANVTMTYAYKDEPLTPAFPGLGLTMPDKLSYTASAEVSC